MLFPFNTDDKNTRSLYDFFSGKINVLFVYQVIAVKKQDNIGKEGS